MYDLKKIEIFLAVAEELNFRKAAERLNTTQSSVSKAIALLEHQIKKQLLKRDTRKICLTTEGIEFYNHSLSLFEKVREFTQKVSQISTPQKTIFRIGTNAAAYVSILPKVINNFQNHHKEFVEIELEELNTEDCIKKIIGKKLDVGIVILPTHHNNIKTKHIYTSMLKLAVSKYHPYAGKRKLPLSMFGKDTFVMHSRRDSPYMYEEIMRCYKQAGINPKIRETDVHENCLGLTIANIGVHFVPKEAENMFIQHELACIEVNPAPSLKLGLAWHTQYPNALTQAFIGEIDAVTKIHL